MCKAPKPPAPKPEKKPEFLRNPVLDRAVSGFGTVQALRSGRNALRIIPGSNSTGRQPGEALSQPGLPNVRYTPSTTPPGRPAVPNLPSIMRRMAAIN